MAKIIALFNLRPGVSARDYEKWARETDLKTARGLKSVDAFNVFRSEAVLGSDETPPYQYFEILDINDLGLLGQEAQCDAMKKVVDDLMDTQIDHADQLSSLDELLHCRSAGTAGMKRHQLVSLRL